MLTLHATRRQRVAYYLGEYDESARAVSVQPAGLGEASIDSPFLYDSCLVRHTAPCRAAPPASPCRGILTHCAPPALS